MNSGGDAKAATMRDVADFAGVALTTVSRAFSEPDKLSPATLRRIQSASRELGYTVNFNARSLRRKTSGMLLVLLPDIGNPFFSLVLKGIESAAREGGRVLLIGDTGSDASLADTCAGQLDAGAVDGLILLDGRLPFAPGSRGRSRLMLSPVVALSERVEAAAVPFVGIDNVGAAREVAHRLADLGHARLAHVAGPPGNSLSVERERGFTLGLAERGLVLTGTRAGDWSTGSGERAAAALLAGPDRPTALFAANDEMAIGAIRVAAALGLAVPGDLSVVGFDDIDVAALHAPTLTTVRQPRFAMGRAAVACLAARIEAGPRPIPPVILAHDLVERASTGPPPPPRARAAHRSQPDERTACPTS